MANLFSFLTDTLNKDSSASNTGFTGLINNVLNKTAGSTPTVIPKSTPPVTIDKNVMTKSAPVEDLSAPTKAVIKTASPADSQVIKDNPVTMKDVTDAYNQRTTDIAPRANDLNINNTPNDPAHNIITFLGRAAQDIAIKPLALIPMNIIDAINPDNWKQPGVPDTQGLTGFRGAASKFLSDRLSEMQSGYKNTFGEDAPLVVKSMRDVKREALKNNPEAPYFSYAPKGVAFGALAGLSAMPLTPEGAGANIIDDIAKTTDKNLILKTLKSSYKNVDESILKGMSEDLSKINTPEGVNDYFKNLSSSVQRGQALLDKSIQEAPTSISSNMDTSNIESSIVKNPQQLDTTLPKALESSKGNISYDNSIAPTEKYFHATSKDNLDNIIKNGFNPSNINKDANYTFLTKDKEIANKYKIQIGKDGIVHQIDLSNSNINLFNFDKEFKAGGRNIRTLGHEFEQYMSGTNLTKLSEIGDKYNGSIIAELQNGSQPDPAMLSKSKSFKQFLQEKGYDGYQALDNGKLFQAIDSTKLNNTIAPEFNADKYVQEQVAAREAARGKTGIVDKAKSFLDTFKKKIVDSTAPIEDILNNSIKENKLNILPEDNIHNQIDRVLRAPTLAGQFASDNGIVDVIKQVDNPDALDQYLIAKHAIELDKQGITTGRDIAKDTKLITALQDKYEPYAKVVSDYSKKLLDYSVDSGLISKDLATKLKELYPDYVPFNRVFNELEKTSNMGGSGGISSLSKQTIVQKIIGSERQIESPLESLLAKTNDAFRQGEKNIAGEMLASYKDLPGNPFQLEDITGQEIGNRHTISFLQDGVKKTFATTKEVAEAAKSLNVQQISILGKMFNLPVRIAKIGITGIRPSFIGANIGKDAVSAFINSDHGLATSILNPKNFIESLFSAVSHNDLYDEMVRSGGAGTSFDISRNQVEKTISNIRGVKNIKDVPSLIKYIVNTPEKLLRSIEDIISRGEEFTRLQQYRGTKEVLLKQGMSEKSASTEAARMAREATVNFARKGEWGNVLGGTFLYLNAGIQGTRTLLRNLATKPIETSTKLIISTLFPVAVATAWNMSDDKRREAYMDIAPYEKENNIIIVPDNPTKDENGQWNIIKIPLSQEVNNLTNAVRRPIEAAHGADPVKFGEFAKALIGTVSPIAPGSVLSSITPQAIKPSIEAATNQSLFTGNPIVPQSLEKLSPEKQIKSDTSKLAIELGQKLGVSPIQIDAFIKSTFGGAATDIIGNKPIIDTVTARFNKAQGGAILDKQYKDQQEIDQQKADISYDEKKKIQPIYDQAQALIKAGKQNEADVLVRKLSDKDWETYKNIKTADKAKETSSAKRKMIPVYEELQKLKATDPAAAQRRVNAMSKEEYHIYDLVRNDFKKINQ